jgi:aminomethyltransferase
MTGALSRSPLHELHLELGARMVPFAGWEMPLQYPQGLRAEHLWTRGHAGLFDVSHMGQVRCRGDGLFSGLEQALPMDFDGWPDGLQKYSLLLNEQGGIEDDLMVTPNGGEVAIVVNASGRAKDLELLQRYAPGVRFELLERALLAVQGPSSAEVVPEASGLRFMQAAALRIGGVDCLVSRSGYTGEDGFEISVAVADAAPLARHFLAHPEIKPVGLGARDTLRLEAALPLHGNDIDSSTTPQEAGLAWAIAPSRRAGGAKAGGYPGADKLAAAQPARRLRCLIGEESVPVRAGAPIVDDGGREVGKVTSGTVSPSLAKPIMMGYVSAAVPQGADLFAIVRGGRHPVTPTRPPFVPKRYKR